MRHEWFGSSRSISYPGMGVWIKGEPCNKHHRGCNKWRQEAKQTVVQQAQLTKVATQELQLEARILQYESQHNGSDNDVHKQRVFERKQTLLLKCNKSHRWKYLIVVFLGRSDEHPRKQKVKGTQNLETDSFWQTRIGIALQIDLVCDLPQKRLGSRIAHLKLEDIQYITLHLNYLQIPKHRSINILR